MRAPPARSYSHRAVPTDRAAATPPAESTGEERQRPHQVGGVGQQPLALGQGLGHESQLALAQVPQPAVDQLGRRRRRARGEVVPLDQGRRQPPGGGVEGHAGAGDPAADDQDVEAPPGQGGQGGGSIEPWSVRHRTNLLRVPTSGGGISAPGGASRPAPGIAWTSATVLYNNEFHYEKGFECPLLGEVTR